MPLTQLIDVNFLKEAIDNCLAHDLYYLLAVCIGNDALFALLDEDIAIKFLEHCKNPNLLLELLMSCLSSNVPDDFTKTLFEGCFTLCNDDPSFLSMIINHPIFVRYADKQHLEKLIQTLPEELFLKALLPKCLNSPRLALLMDRDLLRACMNRYICFQDTLLLPKSDLRFKKEYLIADILQNKEDRILLFCIHDNIIDPFELLAATIIANNDMPKRFLIKMSCLLSSSDSPSGYITSMWRLGNNYLKNFLET